MTLKRVPLQRKTALKPRSERKKRCPSCRVLFKPERPSQAVCGDVECALAHGKSEQGQKKVRKALAEVGRQELKAAKEGIKSRGEHLKEAQTAFNEWVRLRDADQPCISCGRHHQGQYHAGHYRTVGGNPELRFEPLNVHKQCAPCNNHMSGNVVEYRIKLVRKIGLEAVEWLEGPHEPKKYTVEDIKAIKANYRALVRELKKGAA